MVLLVLGLSAAVSSHEDARAFNPKTHFENEPCAVEVERAKQQKQNIEDSEPCAADADQQGAAVEEGLKNKELLEFSPIYQVVSFI